MIGTHAYHLLAMYIYIDIYHAIDHYYALYVMHVVVKI